MTGKREGFVVGDLGRVTTPLLSYSGYSNTSTQDDRPTAHWSSTIDLDFDEINGELHALFQNAHSYLKTMLKKTKDCISFPEPLPLKPYASRFTFEASYDQFVSFCSTKACHLEIDVYFKNSFRVKGYILELFLTGNTQNEGYFLVNSPHHPLPIIVFKSDVDFVNVTVNNNR